MVEFGSVNVDNFKTLQDIGTLVQHSQEVCCIEWCGI